jgi:hypothetical protein
VKASRALLWESTPSQKSGIFNSTLMEIYNIPEKWKLQEHCCGNLHLPRRVEFSTAPLWKSTISQKSGSFKSIAVGIYTFLEEWNFQQHPYENL